MNCCFCGHCYRCRTAFHGVGASICSGSGMYVGGLDCCFNHVRYVYCAHCNQSVRVRNGSIVSHYVFAPNFPWTPPAPPPWKIEVKITPDLTKLNKRRSKHW